MSLTSAQIRRLRAESHRRNLKPVVIIGQKGLIDTVHEEIAVALAHHELIKLRVPGLDRAGKKDLASEICQRHEAEMVQLIGNVVVIFRRNPETDRFAAVLG